MVIQPDDEVTRERLVYTETDDGIALEGVVIELIQQSPARCAVVWIHGNTGSFADYPYIVIGRGLAARGYAFISGNTRGRGIANTLWRMPEDVPVAGGSGWERLEESPLDVAAWVGVAKERGFEQVIVAGHSQGAAKAVLYRAARTDDAVAGIVLASPDLHGHWPTDLVETARQLLAAGNETELLRPFPGTPWYGLSPRNVISRDDTLRCVYSSPSQSSAIAAVDCPILAFFGTQDVGGHDELQTIRRHAIRSSEVTIEIIPGADHVYIGQEAQVADLIAGWISEVDRLDSV